MQEMDKKNLLIIKYGALGDVLRTTYILPGLVKKYKGRARIYWLSSRGATDILRFNPYIYKAVPVTGKTAPSCLRKIRFNYVISLDDEKSLAGLTNFITYDELTGSYVSGGKTLYTKDSVPWFDMGLLSVHGKKKADMLKKRNKKPHNEILGRMLGIEIKKPYFFGNRKMYEEERKVCRRFKYRKTIGLNLNAGHKWPSKGMPVNEARKLIVALAAKRYNVAVLGGKKDVLKNRLILRGIEGGNIHLLQPVGLLRFAARIKNLDLLITSDSLALHFAISQGVKTVSFYSPTSAAEIDTFGTGVKVLSRSADYCSYRPDADNSTITAERVLKAMGKLKF